VRDDFWTSTSNKQLNFVQHVRTLLKINGRAAVVVPDNVLFEGGAGETVRRKLLHECDVHTLLRLPTGVFYAQGVKANVLFFDRKPAREAPWTETLWIYDLCTNKDFSLKQRSLTRADLDEFVACYHPANRHERTPTWSEANPQGRWRGFRYDELLARDKVNLDIFGLRDESLEDSATLPDPDVLAAEIVEDLQAALEQFSAIAEDLAGQEGSGRTRRALGARHSVQGALQTQPAHRGHTCSIQGTGRIASPSARMAAQERGVVSSPTTVQRSPGWGGSVISSANTATVQRLAASAAGFPETVLRTPTSEGGPAGLGQRDMAEGEV
jgi:hypothetical protein